MIRECVTTHGVVRPLESERDLCALGTYLPPGIQRHEKKYPRTMRQIARRREHAIAILHSQDSATEKGAGGGDEGEGWSAAWALEEPDERPPPSSLVARCDTTDRSACSCAACNCHETQAGCTAYGGHVDFGHLRSTRKGCTQER